MVLQQSPAQLAGTAGMNEKTLTVVMPQQRAETLDMGRCDGSAITFGLDEVFLVTDDDLSVQTTVTAVGGIADNRIPLTLERRSSSSSKT